MVGRYFAKNPEIFVKYFWIYEIIFEKNILPMFFKNIFQEKYIRHDIS